MPGNEAYKEAFELVTNLCNIAYAFQYMTKLDVALTTLKQNCAQTHCQ